MRHLGLDRSAAEQNPATVPPMHCLTMPTRQSDNVRQIECWFSQPNLEIGQRVGPPGCHDAGKLEASPCCNLTDCRPTSGRQVDGHYEVKVNGAWVSCPRAGCRRTAAADQGQGSATSARRRGLVDWRTQDVGREEILSRQPAGEHRPCAP